MVMTRAPARLLATLALIPAAGAGRSLPAQQAPTQDSLLRLSGDRQVFALARMLDADSALGGDLRSCLLGQVHAAFRRPEAAALLRRCADGGGPPDLTREALARLAPIYLAAGRFADAADVLARLLTAHSADAGPDDSTGWASGLTLARTLERGAPMRVVSRNPTRIPAKRNAFGMLLVPATVNGQPDELLLDTGAGLSVLMASLAQRLGVRLLPGDVSVSGGTGARMAARLGLARLELAGVALEDVPLLVLPDSLLHVRAGPLELQVRGIVGLPVLVALEEFSLSRDGWLEVAAQPRLRGTSNLAMDGQRLLVEATLDGQAGVFSLDTGARSTTLYPPARPLVGQRAAEGVPGTMQVGGAGGTRTLDVIRLPSVTVGVGDTMVTLRQVPLLAEPANPRARFAAGTLGQDVLGAVPLLTMNLQQMILRLAGTP
jgi:predicted aspartyl protease